MLYIIQTLKCIDIIRDGGWYEMSKFSDVSSTADSGRKMKLVLAGLIVAVLGAGAVMFAAGMAAKNRETSAETGEAAAGGRLIEIDFSAGNAEKLYDCRVEDVNDSAAVAKLLETMGLADIAGRYTTTVINEDGVRVLIISFTEPVRKKNEEVLDKNMKNCAYQLMALMPEVGKVQWTYMLSSGDTEESVSASADEAAATEMLTGDVKECGASAADFEKLLKILAEAE